jgi:PAS domain S-box-containing protein
MLLPALIRVLHVDDEESQREFAKMFLEQDGVIQVTSATSGKEALQLLEKESYDCVVSDYMLPGMDGVELARRIRETSTVPFILYADREIVEVAEAAFKVGIDDYVRKEVEPAHFQVLARRIRQAVERARGEKNLKVSEEKFRRFFMNQPVLCYMVSKEGNILDVNKTVLDTLGYTREELIGKPVITTLYSPSSRGKAEQLFKRWVKTGVVRNEELNIVTKTGEERTVLLNVDAVRDERGGVIQGISVQVDITQRRQMEEELRESEERFRTLVENSPNAISVTIGDTIIYANQKRAELAGKDDPSELVGTSSISQIAEGDRESIVERMEARKRGEKLPLSYEFRMLRADGSIRDIIGYSSAISYQGNNAVQHVLHDVTEQKRHEAMLEALHKHSADLSKAETVEEVAEETLDCVERVIGFNVGSFAVVEGDLLRHIHIKGVESAGVFEIPLDGRGVTVRAVRTGETQLVPDCREDDDYEPGLASGIFEALSEIAVPVKVSGKVVAVINVESTKLDAFTEEDRKLMEILASHVASALRKIRDHGEIIRRQKLMEDLYENAPVMYMSLDAEGVIIRVNRTTAEALGYRKEELTGRPMASLLSESSVKAFREEFPVLLESGELHGAERQLVRRDGSIIEAILDASVEYDEGRPVSTRAVMRDITLMKMAERRVREMAFNMEGLTPGSCYVCEDHERSMRAFAGMLLHGVPGLCLAREDPGRLVAEYGVDQRSILLVSSQPVAGFEAVADLQEVNRVITRFLKEHKTPMVLLDGLEYLVARFGFEAVYAFLQEKRFVFLEAKAVLLIPLDLATLSETERALLTSELKILE